MDDYKFFWTDVDVALPEISEDVPYLVTHLDWMDESEKVTVAYHEFEGMWFEVGEDYLGLKVIAWARLPKAYVRKDNNNERN